MLISLYPRFASLPKPIETEWDFELPPEQTDIVSSTSISEEDAAERDRRNATLREAAMKAELLRRTQVLQRGLPRPLIIDTDALAKSTSEVEDPIEGSIAKEMALLIANDALKYPAVGSSVRGSSGPLESFDDKELNRARLEIASELPTSGMENRQAEFDKAWEDVHGSSHLPGLAVYDDDEIDEALLTLEAFDTIQSSLIAAAQKGNAIEKKLAVHLGGYHARQKTLRNKIVEAAQALENERRTLEGVRVMQVSEEAGIEGRLEGLRAEVGFVSRREREGQEVYRDLRQSMERSNGVNGLH